MQITLGMINFDGCLITGNSSIVIIHCNFNSGGLPEQTFAEQTGVMP